MLPYICVRITEHKKIRAMVNKYMCCAPLLIHAYCPFSCLKRSSCVANPCFLEPAFFPPSYITLRKREQIPPRFHSQSQSGSQRVQISPRNVNLCLHWVISICEPEAAGGWGGTRIDRWMLVFKRGHSKIICRQLGEYDPTLALYGCKVILNELAIGEIDQVKFETEESK